MTEPPKETAIRILRSLSLSARYITGGSHTLSARPIAFPLGMAISEIYPASTAKMAVMTLSH
jgi:hypothetical protein